MTLRADLKRYVDRLLIRRRRNACEEALLRCMGCIRPTWVEHRSESLSEWVSRLRVSIFSPSDSEANLYKRLQWGDYWAQYELTKALGELGYLVTRVDPDIVIHLFGTPMKLPPRALKIGWIYSHPERVTPELLGQYDRIFCISSQFTQKIRDMGFAAEWAPGATARRPRSNSINYDIVFVGNTRKRLEGNRQIIMDLGNTHYDLKVWGNGWEQVLSEHYIGGKYVDYGDLTDLYSSARISLCDHSPEMGKEGFVALRVFDILGSGGFCISDLNAGIEEIFGDAVPQYQTGSDLRELVHYYISQPEARQACMQKGQAIVTGYTWQDRAQQLLQGLEPCMTQQ